MALVCATGKHRKPGRVKRTTASGGRRRGPHHHRRDRHPRRLPGDRRREHHGADRPRPRPRHDRGRPPSRSTREAAAQQQAAEEKAAEEAAAKAAAERAKEVRAAKARAAREAERKRLNTFVAPIAHSYVSTAYQAGSSLWSSGSHTPASTSTRPAARPSTRWLRHGRLRGLGRRVRQPGRDPDGRRHVHPVRPPVVHRRHGWARRSSPASRSASPAPPATSPARTCTSRRARPPSTARTSTRSPTSARHGVHI